MVEWISRQDFDHDVTGVNPYKIIALCSLEEHQLQFTLSTEASLDTLRQFKNCLNSNVLCAKQEAHTVHLQEFEMVLE